MVATSGWVRQYLQRLGIGDPGRPSVQALFALHRAQTERVAYENVDIFLGRPQGIEPGESIDRILRGRGGYCYNLNGALATLLAALGYQVSWHAGAVHNSGSDPSPGEYRNHLAATVELDGGTWMIDAGLGEAHHEPIPLRAGEHRQIPFVFRLATLPRVPGGWRFSNDPAMNPRFEMDFTLGQLHWQDFAAKHAQLSTDPGSPFVRICQLHRRDERGVDGMIGCVLHQVAGPGQRTETELLTRADWFGAAADIFDLRLDDLTVDDRDHLSGSVCGPPTRPGWLSTKAPRRPADDVQVRASVGLPGVTYAPAAIDTSRRENLNLVLATPGIRGHEGKTLTAGLRDQHAIKRITVDQRQASRRRRVVKPDRQFAESTVTNAPGEVSRCRDLPECLFDADLPERRCTDPNVGLGVDGVLDVISQRRVVG